MIPSVLACLGALAFLIHVLGSARESLGLPIAYLFALLFIHLPGAFAQIVGGPDLTPVAYTEMGIRITMFGVSAFVGGVLLGGGGKREYSERLPDHGERVFPIFCLVAGLITTYGVSRLTELPSVGAALDKGGAIWVLGVLLGLRVELQRRNLRNTAWWFAAMMVYPLLTLLLAGFLSFGSTPVFVVLAGIMVATRSKWRRWGGLILFSFVFFHVFLSYFQNREEIRDAVWGNESISRRIEASLKILTELQIFNPYNDRQVQALDQRLNQNYFVGMVEEGFKTETLHYSKWDGLNDMLLSLIPRIIWAEKSVFGGSPGVIADLTGFVVNQATSFGVGHVLDLYRIYGLISLIIGFLALGLIFGYLDREAAIASRTGDFGRAIACVLPLVAMIHPNGSLVELVGGAAAAAIAALMWRGIWYALVRRQEGSGAVPPRWRFGSVMDGKSGRSNKW